MIQGRCPICGNAFEVAALDDMPSFPFCSDRCRLVDLGRWIDGTYAIPEGNSGSPDATESSTAVGDEVEDD
jgi:endogenous inhibitor of DNA gyrase (YacG/DUF329 family)